MPLPPNEQLIALWSLALSPEHQELVAEKLAWGLAHAWSTQPGYWGGRVLRGLDGSKLCLELTWSDRSAYEAALATEPVRSHRAVLVRFGVIDAALYETAHERPKQP